MSNIMTYKTTIKPLLLGSAALLFASMASAEGMQIDTDLDIFAAHTSLGDFDGDGDSTSSPLHSTPMPSRSFWVGATGPSARAARLILS